MKNSKFFLAVLCLLLPFFAWGQGKPSQSNYPPVLLTGSGAPAGNCTGTNYLYLNTANGNLYTCPVAGSAWVLAGGGSGTPYSWFGNTANPLTALVDPTIISDAVGNNIGFTSSFLAWGDAAGDTCGFTISPPSINCQDFNGDFLNLAGGIVTFQDAAGNTCTLTGGAFSCNVPVSGSNTVTSVFTRTGPVVAATNDYNFNQLAGTLGTSQVPTGGSATVFLNGAGTYTAPTGAVLSVSNSDGTLTCSPTTGSVTCSIALGHANTWTGVQTFNLPLVVGSVGGTGGSIQHLGTTSGNVQPGCVPATTCTAYGSGSAPSSFTKYNTTTNCGANGTAANPSVVSCGSAGAGSISCSASASAGTCTVNDTAVTANSNIILTSATYVGTRLAVTCNTAVITGDFVSAISAGTSFTITLPVFTTNPECFTYQILN